MAKGGFTKQSNRVSEEIKENAALGFLSTATVEATTKEPVLSRSDYAAENKSKRLNLLVRPSVYEDIKRLANIDSTTPNNLINEALAAYCSQRKTDIQKYYDYHKEE